MPQKGVRSSFNFCECMPVHAHARCWSRTVKKLPQYNRLQRHSLTLRTQACWLGCMRYKRVGDLDRANPDSSGKNILPLTYVLIFLRHLSSGTIMSIDSLQLNQSSRSDRAFRSLYRQENKLVACMRHFLLNGNCTLAIDDCEGPLETLERWNLRLSWTKI